MKVHKFTRGDTLRFWAKGYVNFVNFRFSALFLHLFLLYHLIFLVMRRIHVNESAQVNLCPWMCTCITNADPVYRKRSGSIRSFASGHLCIQPTTST